MRRKLLNIAILLLLLMSTSALTSAQQRALITAKMDSTYLLMGKKTAIHIELTQGKDDVGYFVGENSDRLTDFVEVSSRTEADTVDIGSNRIQINRDLIIQSFDSGLYVIPEQQFVIGVDTFRSNPLTLKVIPVFVDSLTNIHDFKPVEGVPFRLLDFLPSFIADYWWVYLLVLILIGGGLFVYFKWLRKGRVPLLPKKKPIPPFEEAMSRLEALKQKQLWQAGQDKEYYTELTDILRVYIFRRFGINAVEMTSSQIIATLRRNEETRAVNEQLNMILEVADFVKFAKMRPLPDDNERSMSRAVNFVNETKPVVAPEVQSEESDQESDKSAQPENKPKKEK